MHKESTGTRKASVLNVLFLIFLTLNIVVAASAYFDSYTNAMLFVFTLPLLFLLCILLIVVGKRDISDSNKLLAGIATAAFISVMFSGSDVVLLIVMIVGALACLALVILTVRRLVSGRTKVPQ